MLLFIALISVFVFWSPTILVYTFHSISIFIEDFTLYGKSLDNMPLNLPEVEITSPKNGEYVYLSSELTVKGTSSDTSNTNCKILMSINNIQPFQNAIGIGLPREQDYSAWNSTFFNATNLLRLGTNTITSFIVCLDNNNNTPTSSSHLINITGLPFNDNQSILSSVSEVIHDDLENNIVGRHENSHQSALDLQNDQPTRPVHDNNDQSQSQHQSTLSPNSGQSTTQNH